MTDPGVRRLRLFFDTDALLAGAASTRGASHLLLQLAELGLVEIVTSDYVRDEAVRNVGRKLPAAAPLLSALLGEVVTTISMRDLKVEDAPVGVHTKDLPVWAAYRASEADFLVTFNLRHYPARETVVTPGDVIHRIRTALARLQPEMLPGE